MIIETINAPVPIEKGGTGGGSISEAQANLNVLPLDGSGIVRKWIKTSNHESRVGALEVSASGNVNIINGEDDTFANSVRIHLKPETTSNVANLLRLTIYEDGAETATYKIYGEHNKPTATDVGAVSLEGNSNKNGFLYFTNTDRYGAVYKNRVIDDISYRINFGLGKISATKGPSSFGIEIQMPNEDGGYDNIRRWDFAQDGNLYGGSLAYRFYNTSNMTKGTTDLIAGTSSLNTDDIYLVYE